MAPVTEVVLLTLVPDAVHDAVAGSAKIMAAQPGCLAVRTARELRRPDAVHYLIDWDSLESHRAFARGDHHGAYRRMWDLVCPVMAAHSAPFHVTFAPPALDGRRGTPTTTTTTTTAEAGAAAVYTLLGKVWCRAPDEGSADEGKEDADADTDAEADVEAAFEGFLAAATATAGGGGGGRGVAAGWSLERDIAHGGVPCRVFAFVVGWDDDGGGGGASRTSRRDARLAGAVAAAFGDGGGARTVEVCLLGAWDREV